jgi:hypothetical protein
MLPAILKIRHALLRNMGQYQARSASARERRAEPDALLHRPVVGQLVDRDVIQRGWTDDGWHLGNRLLRTVLAHTPAILLTIELGNPPVHLARHVVPSRQLCKMQ